MDVLLSISSNADSSSREIKSAIGDGLVVGRGVEHGVLLDGPDLSREHLVITAEGSILFVTDLSSNGTWVNGTRLQRSTKTRITSDDLIEIPGYALRVKPADQPEKPAQIPIVRADPPPVTETQPVFATSGAASKSSGMLAPVLGFFGSFTFFEKLMVVVAAVGLALLFSYFGS